MSKRNITVIGASAGGFEATKKLVVELPATLDASNFIVWHMSPHVISNLLSNDIKYSPSGEQLLYNPGRWTIV